MSAIIGTRPGADALIVLEQAGVRFGARTALEPIDFTLRSGDRVALVGANGAGKSTLLRLLHGQVVHSGRRVMPAGPVQMALLYQRPFLLSLSVEFNLNVALWLAGVPRGKRKRRVVAALAHVGLADVARTPALDLSGGQQQRLALARAWAVRPRILLLDEPTASLDPTARHAVEDLIAGFAQEGMAIVLSTHSLAQARRLATRVVCLSQSRLAVDASAKNFFEGDLPAAAASFLCEERL